MTAMTLTTNRNSAPRSVIVLAIIIALAAVSMHAIARHGMAAIAASQCADRPQLTMYNPETGRFAHICLTERGWGVSIVARDGGPVTSFIKEKLHSIEQVVRYLRNTGYEIR